MGRGADSTDATARTPVAMRVLASGSGGNCTILAFGDGPDARLALIDLGLGPRKTRQTLRMMGFEFHQIDDILLTHLDGDHCAASWTKYIPSNATLRIHHKHMRRAERLHLLFHRTEPFGNDPFEITRGARVDPLHLSHDSLGVAAFRVHVGNETLGFVTDVGCVSDSMLEHFAGVDVLAIESNYCPTMQMASSRPAFLKQRIMGGSGHLSNQESAGAVREIGPRREVVLLHLSRQCNRPDVAAREHDHEGVELTISNQFAPTDWIQIAGAESALLTRNQQLDLFPKVETRGRRARTA